VVGESGHCPDIPDDNTPRSFGILFSEQAFPKVLDEFTDCGVGPGGDRKKMDVYVFRRPSVRIEPQGIQVDYDILPGLGPRRHETECKLSGELEIGAGNDRE
jgi:hypothetical protein